MAEATAAMRKLRADITRAAFAIVLLVLLQLAFASRVVLTRLLRPLEGLGRAAGRIARGEAPAADVRGFRETRALGRTMASLGAEIAAQRAALADSNRRLEGEVAERTAELRAGHARLAEIDASRRRFFAQIGHELRTPATVIRGEAEVALRNPEADSAQLRDALAHIIANSAFLDRRLADLLALARAEDGRLALHRGPADLVAVVREAVSLATPFALSSGIRIEAAVRDEVRTEGDASWLSQALLALTDNAVKVAS